MGGIIVDGSPKDSPADGTADAVQSAPRRASFLRVLQVLATTVVVLVGVRLAAPVLNPIFFAVVLSLLFGPIYAWLGRRGLPKPVALVVMLSGMTLLFAVIFYVLGASIARFSAGIGSYSSELGERLASIQVLVDRIGLANVNLRDVVEPRALTGAVGVVLSGIASFLSNLFLILMIVLFLLAEGPALMDRLRASAGEDHPQVERLAFVGRGVVRQFGLRAILNLVTAVGITVLLLTLGVDFALMWGILVFFLAFVPYIGLVLAAASLVLLALAEFGVGPSSHRGGDGRQHPGGERPLAGDDEPGPEHLPDGRVSVVRFLGLVARGTGRVSGPAHDPLRCCDARHLSRDALVGQRRGH